MLGIWLISTLSCDRQALTLHWHTVHVSQPRSRMDIAHRWPQVDPVGTSGGPVIFAGSRGIVDHFWVPSVLVDCTATDRGGNLANLSNWELIFFAMFLICTALQRGRRMVSPSCLFLQSSGKDGFQMLSELLPFPADPFAPKLTWEIWGKRPGGLWLVVGWIHGRNCLLVIFWFLFGTKVLHMWVSTRHFGIPREFSFFSRSTAITRNARLRQFQGGSSSQGVYVYSPFRYVEVAWV